MASEIISETSGSEESSTSVVVEMTSKTTVQPTSHVVSNKEAIEALLKRSGYPLVQENGQRKYGPPPNWQPSSSPPDRSCEVFIGKIPRDCFEDELVPLMERVGYLYEFRLMMEYSGYNRGYGFAMFTTREDAKKAVNELNNFEIRKGRTIGVCRSVDNCRLFVGGIPKSKKKEEILDEMRKVTDDVMNIIVYPSAHDKTKNRGFAFVQYANHRAAAIARRKLIQNKIQLFEQPIAVDWAEPEPEVDESVMATVKVLYVRNLMLTTTEEQIKMEFERIKEGSVERVKKLKDFAFVHFKEREDALNALSKMNGATLDGALIECSLSKPAEKTSLSSLSSSSAINSSSASLLKLTKNVLNNPALVAAAAAAAAANNQFLDINMLLNSSTALIGLSPYQTVDQSLSPPGAAAAAAAQLMPYLTGPPQLSHPAMFAATTGSYMQQPTPTGYDLNAMAHHFLIPNDHHHHQLHHHHHNSISPNNNSAATSTPTTNMSAVSSKTTNGRPGRLGATNVLSGGLNTTTATALITGQNGGNARNMYRSAYSTGFRNIVPGGGTVKKQASSQEVPYDLYTTGGMMNPVPLLPISQNQMKNSGGNNSAVQVLEEICGKEGLGMPVYSLHTTSGVDHHDGGKEIGLYTYKVSIPSLFGGAQLTSNKLSKSIDEAKNEAAAYALAQIIPPPPPQPLTTAPAAFQPSTSSFIDLNEVYYNSAAIQQQQQQQVVNTSQTTSPSSVNTPSQQQQSVSSLTPPSTTTGSAVVTTTAPTTTGQPMGLVYHDNQQLSQQELQSIIAAAASAAAAGQSGGLNNLSITSSNNNETLLKNWQLATTAAINNNLNGGHALQPPPPPPEYFQTVLPPQYIIDPSGKYLLCQTLGWQ